jgi:glyoxylase I family protein
MNSQSQTLVNGRLVRADHMGITVTDLDRSLAFWCDLLGFERGEAGRAEGEWVDEIVGFDGAVIEEVNIHGAGISIALMKCLSPNGTAVRPRGYDPGCIHLAFICENAEAIYARLRAAGVVMRSTKVVTIPVGGYAGAKDFYCLDPDGVSIEFVETQRG